MQGRKRLLDEDHDAVSHFIWCVKKRPALYNYKLPTEQRRRSDVARLWEELADEVGSLSAEQCRKKWKNLRDTYHQYRLRKIKYKECLEKWRYTTDLSFLTEIYQPKLKSERAKYMNSRNNTIHEVKPSDISSLIELDEETTQDSHSFHKEFIIDQNEYDDETMEHNMNDTDENSLQFCGVEDTKDVEPVGDESYGEVYLYDEADTNVVAVDSLVIPTQHDNKENIVKKPLNSKCTFVDQVEAEEYIEAEIEAATFEGSCKDELDLFFQFLKSKIQKLPSVDITAIQIEFLNAVLRREAAHVDKTVNVNK